MGFRRAKVTQRNTNLQKNIVVEDRFWGHHAGLKRKKYFTNPSCLPHWQRKTSPRSTALVTAESVCNHSSAHAGIPHWSRAPPPLSKLTLAFDRRFGNTRDRFLNEQNHLSYQKLHIRKRLVLLMLLKNR